jgi:hypothetical protein
LSWHLDPAPWRFAGNSRESPGGTPPARSVIINSEFNNGFVSGGSLFVYKLCHGACLQVSVVTARVAYAVLLQELKLPKELELLLLAHRTIIYTIRQASEIRLTQ